MTAKNGGSLRLCVEKKRITFAMITAQSKANRAAYIFSSRGGYDGDEGCCIVAAPHLAVILRSAATKDLLLAQALTGAAPSFRRRPRKKKRLPWVCTAALQIL
jgi:hypothetical protein